MLWFKVFSQLSLGIILILSSGFAGLYYITKYDNGSSIKNEISELDKQQNVVKKEIEGLKTELKNLNELDQSMKLMGGRINEFLEYIPNTLESHKILEALNTGSKKAGVNLKSTTQHGNLEKEDFYEKIKVSATVEGGFTQVLVFLNNLVSLKEILTVERFTIDTIGAKKDHSVGFNEVKMQMDIYGYRYTSAIIEENIMEKKNEKVF